jgi:hypothetical protein
MPEMLYNVKMKDTNEFESSSNWYCRLEISYLRIKGVVV